MLHYSFHCIAHCIIDEAMKRYMKPHPVHIGGLLAFFLTMLSMVEYCTIRPQALDQYNRIAKAPHSSDIIMFKMVHLQKKLMRHDLCTAKQLCINSLEGFINFKGVSPLGFTDTKRTLVFLGSCLCAGMQH